MLQQQCFSACQTAKLPNGRRLPPAAVLHGRHANRRVCCAAAATAPADSQKSLGSCMAAGLLGAAAGLGLLLPSSVIAMEEGMPMQQPQEEVAAAASLLQPEEQQQPAAPQSCFVVASDLSEAPSLVSDAGEQTTSPACREPGSLEATLVNGLGWMVEEAHEVTNFTENNFAAVGAPSSSMWLANSPWCLMWDAYCNVLTTRPVATKLATGMVGTFLGDMLAQFMQKLIASHNSTVASMNSSRRGRSSSSGPQLSEAEAAPSHSSHSSGSSSFELDLSRTARLVGFSALVGTPVAFVWFSLLDQYVFPAEPTSPLAVFSKVACDQVLMAPLMTSVFFAAMAYLEGCRSGQEVVATVKSKLKSTLLANWTVWPLAHVINFALVPPAQRILYINVVNIAWTAFMSHMANNSESSESKAATQQQPGAARNKQLQQATR